MQGLLQSTLRDSPLIMPEVMLSFFGLAILLTDFLLEAKQKAWNALTAGLGVIFSGVALWLLRPLAAISAEGFHGAIVIDPFFMLFGFIFLAATLLVIFLSVRYLEIEDEHHGEYYALMLFSTVGMMFLACGNDLITLFIALETMALSFYVLSGFLRRDRRSNEGALKYVLLGAFSSGILAYGFSLLYGISGSTNLNTIATVLAQRPHGDLMVVIAVMTVSAGVFFKIAAVPFHQWAPDVYEGAPTPITAYVSVASKTASFALLLRLIPRRFLAGAHGLDGVGDRGCNSFDDAWQSRGHHADQYKTAARVFLDFARGLHSSRIGGGKRARLASDDVLSFDVRVLQYRRVCNCDRAAP